jgi:hypothetical protein
MDTIEQLLSKNGVNFFDSVSDLKVIRKINKLMRERDQSHLYPINGEYNATERAIRWYSRVYFPANGSCSALEYALGLENLISNYVNKF